MSLFSTKEQQRAVLVLDVQSSIVRASIDLIGAHGTPQILFTTSAPISYKPHTDSSYLVKVTLHAVCEVIDACMRHVHLGEYKDEPRTIHEIHFVLSSPWIVSQAKTLAIESAKPVTVTREYIAGLIEEERSKLASGTGDSVKVIEEKILDVRVNGYSITAWEGKVATKLQVSYTISVAGTRMVDRFVASCGHIVKPAHIFFHSSLMLQHMGYEQVAHTPETYALVHVHGELTDAAVIRGHSCTFFGSFPTGVRSMIRKIATDTSTDARSAESLLALYIGEHLDPNHAKPEAETIQTIATDWVNNLKKMFESSGSELVPVDFAISAVAHDEFFAKLLASAYTKSRTGSLSIDDILPHVVFSDRAQHQRLTALYALALGSMLDDQSL